MGLSFYQISRDANHAAYDMPRLSQFGQEDQIWIEDTPYPILSFTVRNFILSYFTISKNYFINYTISFYNTPTISTFVLPYYTLK